MYLITWQEIHPFVFLFIFKRFNKVVVPDPKSFFWIAASITDAAAVYPNGNRALLANGLSTFFIKGKISFNNCLKICLKIPLIVLFK